MSYAYLHLFKDVKYYCFNKWIWAEDDKWILFTPFYDGKIQLFEEGSGDIKLYPASFLSKPIWTDYENSNELLLFPSKMSFEFFDFEYIYSPHSFLKMEGGKWETFRKNSKKWSRINPDWKYTSLYCNDNDISNLLIKWLITTNEKIEIQDEFVFYNLVLMSSKTISPKKYLLNKEGKLIGINIYDFNWHYCNYRICISDPDEKYANEFLRYLFYTDPIIRNSGKLVNDGGCLNSLSLEKFKDKLNPLYKNIRKSITIKN